MEDFIASIQNDEDSYKRKVQQLKEKYNTILHQNRR